MGTAAGFLSSEARVATPMPRLRARQLCNQFRRSVPVRQTARRGLQWQARIEFPQGVCHLAATEKIETLIVSLDAADEPQLAALEAVIAAELGRVAARDGIAVNWTRRISSASSVTN